MKSLFSSLARPLAAASLLLPGLAWAQNAYIPNFDDGTVSVIDTVTNTVSATITLPSTFPEGVAVTPDGSKVLITSRAGNQVTGDQNNGALTIIDTATNRVAAQLTTAPGPIGVAITPNGQKAYFVTSNSLGTTDLFSVDLTTNTLAPVAQLPDQAFSLVLSPDGTKAYVVVVGNAANNHGSLQRVDLASGAVTGSVVLGDDPECLAITPDGKTLYITDFLDSSVFVVPTATLQVSTQIRVGGAPFGIAVTPDGRHVWAANVADSNISVIDTATNQVTATFFGGTGNNAVGFTPDGTHAYVPDGEFSTSSINKGTRVSVVDTATLTETQTIAVGTGAAALGNFIGPAPATPPAPSLLSAVLPSSRSVQEGHPATVLATMLNATPDMLNNCQIALQPNGPLSLRLAYQATDPSTNTPIGQPNTPVSIAGNGSQSFLLTFTSASAFIQPGIPLTYRCDNVAQAAVTTGLNTVDLYFAQLPIPDVIALEATATPGVVEIPVSQGGGAAFAVATANVGIAQTLTVRTDTGSATLPVALSVCQTNPADGSCLAPPAPTVQVDFDAGATPTFSVFAVASGAIPFDPAHARLFVRFEDSSGTSYGATSVAVATD